MDEYVREDCCVLCLIEKVGRTREKRMVVVRDVFDCSMSKCLVGCIVEFLGVEV
jgi:hypothetical protein